MDARAIAEWFDVFDWSPTDPGWLQRRKATWAWRKFKKARRWARVLHFVPFVRMIAIGNALGYGNCSPESDIDLVIVTAPRHIWTVRLLVVALLRLFHQRPGEHTRDAICPSFFLTTEAMDFEQLQLDHSSFIIHHSSFPPDPYLLFWLTQLTVLSDVGGTYDAFWHANEAWVRRWLPNARPRAVHPRLSCKLTVSSPDATVGIPIRSRRGCKLWRGTIECAFGDSVGDALERWCRRFQERRFSPEIRALANQDSRVIVNERMLKFHTNDRRAHYCEQWVRRLAANESSVPA